MLLCAFTDSLTHSLTHSIIVQRGSKLEYFGRFAPVRNPNGTDTVFTRFTDTHTGEVRFRVVRIRT